VIVPEHVYRTSDGTLVKAGHPGAAFLAFAKGDEVGDLEASKNGLEELLTEPPAPKAAPKPADKSAARTADK